MLNRDFNATKSEMIHTYILNGMLSTDFIFTVHIAIYIYDLSILQIEECQNGHKHWGMFKKAILSISRFVDL